MNNKKGHNIVNDKTAALLISQTAYLLKKETKTFTRNLKNTASIHVWKGRLLGSLRVPRKKESRGFV